MVEQVSPLRRVQAIVLAALAVLAWLMWPGRQGDILFWAYQLVLAAVLLAGQAFRASYAIPGPSGAWGGRERLRLGLVQGSFFMALMLVTGAHGAPAAPLGWLLAALTGGLVFGAVAALSPVFGPVADAERLAEYDRSVSHLDRPGERVRLYLMPLIMLGIAPALVLPGGLLAPQLGLPLFVLLAVAIAEPGPLFPRTAEAERRALWTRQRHLLLRLAAVILLGLVLWQRL
jgi:hypothetical protein